ncbi:hypothetical protein AKO1_015334 [Acrasis kona]|uniref:Uncharacterized protein n=1 Tax=Acrasis kona TaxID=1008807 RepID=A0AAW2ZHS0_9EUKA
MTLLQWVLVLSVLFAATTYGWQSNIVKYDARSHKLTYQRDGEGNVIPDFSYSGYHSGADIPNIPVVKTLDWKGMDDHTGYIQAAIDQVSSLPINNTSQYRGALLLRPGKYNIRGTIRIRASGVVLRGSGQGHEEKTDTILYALGDNPHQRTVVIAGNGKNDHWSDQVQGTKTNVINDMKVGDNVVKVEKQSFKVGDTVVITYPTTDAWLKSVNYGEPEGDPKWTPQDQFPIIFNRLVTAVNGNEITIDAPVFNSLKRSLSQSYVYKYDKKNTPRHIGVENLRIDVQTNGRPDDENHAWTALSFVGSEHVWVRRCTMIHFGFAGVDFSTTVYGTVDGVTAVRPVAITTGGRMYNFCASEAAQQILFKNCKAADGRHHYVSNGASRASGIVFFNSTCDNNFASSEGHRRWSTGLLYDNIISKSKNLALGIYNRGNYGSSHGWSAANSVAWNVRVVNGGSICVQKPPTAQNFGIGCHGYVTGKKPPCAFSKNQGYIEGTNKDGLEPRSLYEAQLAQRKF